MVSVSLTPHITNVDEFLSHCHRRRFPAKSTLIYAGDQSESLYYIVKGSVTVSIEDEDGREIIVAYLNPGDFFGEMGMFEEGDRSAWVRAKTECEVGEISYTKFQELIEDHPEFLFAVGSREPFRIDSGGTSLSVTGATFPITFDHYGRPQTSGNTVQFTFSGESTFRVCLSPLGAIYRGPC